MGKKQKKRVYVATVSDKYINEVLLTDIVNVSRGRQYKNCIVTISKCKIAIGDRITFKARTSKDKDTLVQLSNIEVISNG